MGRRTRLYLLQIIQRIIGFSDPHSHTVHRAASYSLVERTDPGIGAALPYWFIDFSWTSIIGHLRSKPCHVWSSARLEVERVRSYKLLLGEWHLQHEPDSSLETRTAPFLIVPAESRYRNVAALSGTLAALKNGRGGCWPRTNSPFLAIDSPSHQQRQCFPARFVLLRPEYARVGQSRGPNLGSIPVANSPSHHHSHGCPKRVCGESDCRAPQSVFQKPPAGSEPNTQENLDLVPAGGIKSGAPVSVAECGLDSERACLPRPSGAEGRTHLSGTLPPIFAPWIST